jgi:hypothetical protein
MGGPNMGYNMTPEGMMTRLHTRGMRRMVRKWIEFCFSPWCDLHHLLISASLAKKSSMAGSEY